MRVVTSTLMLFLISNAFNLSDKLGGASCKMKEKLCSIESGLLFLKAFLFWMHNKYIFEPITLNPVSRMLVKWQVTKPSQWQYHGLGVGQVFSVVLMVMAVVS